MSVVGYSQTEMVDGFKAMSASFVSVGSEGIKLTQIVPTGADTITSAVNPVQLQTLGPTGNMKALYTYHLNDTARAYKGYNGWYAGTTPIKDANDVDFPAGTGFWVSGKAALSLQTSGEVLMDSLNCQLVDGFRLVANPYPVAVKLTSIVPTGADTITSAVNPVQLQTLGPTGNMKALYTYHLNDTARAYKGYNGWYAGTTPIKDANDVDIPAGGSVWVSGSASIGLTITTPFEAE